MKGFIYLIEIAIAGILLTVVLGLMFSAQAVKLDWERSDLIAIGNNILNTANISKILLEDFEEISKLKPENVEYGIRISGTPIANASVACISNCEYIRRLLTSTTINGRYVRFNVIQTNIDSIDDYDLFVTDNMNVIINNKAKILEYLKRKVIVAIVDIQEYNNDFNEIFGLTPASGSSTYLKINNKEVSKNIIGLGFDILLTGGIGEWYIWEISYPVTLREGKVVIQGIGEFSEGDTFTLSGPNGKGYTFKIKKINSGKVEIQVLDYDFVFKNFANEKLVTGNNLVSSHDNSFGTVTKNGNAIWISGFPKSDEYETLVKSVIGINNWYLKDVETDKETVTISSFTNMCCDVPEVIELTFVLWYRF